MIEYDASFLYSSLFLTRRLIKASRVLHLVSPSTKHALDLSRKTEGCIAIARAKWKRMEQCASTLLALSSAARKRCRSGAALPASEVLVSPSSHRRSAGALWGCSNCFSQVPSFSSSTPSLLAARLLILRRRGKRTSNRRSSIWRRRSSQYASRCSVHLLWFSHYEVCYDHCGRFPYSHWRADQSVASSDTTCCPVEAEEIPLARCRSMMVHLTREMSCPSPNSCGYRRTMSSGCRPQ